MQVFKLKDMFKGWFVGDFEPTTYKSDQFEVCYRVHPKGEEWGWHYHKEIVEINLLVSGKMVLQGKTLSSGDIFVLRPYEMADPSFLEDCAIVCIKTPSIPGDKHLINKGK